MYIAMLGLGTSVLVACGVAMTAEPQHQTQDVACVDCDDNPIRPLVTSQLLASLKFPVTPNVQVQNSIVPLSLDAINNVEAVIPPQCYTKHEEKYNPCMTCHQTYPTFSRPNAMNDGNLQKEYDFSDVGAKNHWVNLFEDRSERIKKISNQAVIDYIYTDNYTPLVNKLKSLPEWKGYVPDLQNLQLGSAAFDELGFAKDGSQWVAFNYKPFPSTFWPTNGSTDDVIIRLPKKFRQACDSTQENKDAYIANLSIMEMAVKELKTISTPEIDENLICTDLNGDNKLTKVAQINAQPTYVGAAKAIKTQRMLYPKGVEFIHTVRYIGVKPNGEIFNPPRLKEFRYMKKIKDYSVADLRSKYGNEHQEKMDENLPSFNFKAEEGSSNNFGWIIHGFIEDKVGSLRLQNQEETAFCMGCHTTIGTTIDQTFAFPRKVTGADGWGYINLKGMKDAPNVGMTEGEFLNYMRAVGGGDEFRQNDEMIKKWFDNNHQPIAEKVKDKDVYTLITPSVERALDLNKAYMTIVKDQDFIHGRDANIKPATNVYKEVDGAKAPVLPEDKVRNFDMRLNW